MRGTDRRMVPVTEIGLVQLGSKVGGAQEKHDRSNRRINCRGPPECSTHEKYTPQGWGGKAGG